MSSNPVITEEPWLCFLTRKETVAPAPLSFWGYLRPGAVFEPIVVTTQVCAGMLNALGELLLLKCMDSSQGTASKLLLNKPITNT